MFWELEHYAATSSGFFDAATRTFVSYEELLARISELQKTFPTGRKLLAALLCDNSLPSIITYLALLRSGHAAILLNKSNDPSLHLGVFEQYRPELILHSGGGFKLPAGYTPAHAPSSDLSVSIAAKPDTSEVHPETALLLSTSGTTGSPKLIRLSYRNIQSNAEAIVQYLAIGPHDKAISSLPMSYSYGLSVINSHLLAGANLVFTNSSIVEPDFWGAFKDRQCTSLAGVPFTYSMLERLRFERMNLPSLKTLTQAGGRLAPDRILQFAQSAQKKGLRFFVMYGQTEATARISYVPWERLREKIGSVGIAIPGGELQIADGRGEGEIVYRGPNVMLGYAESRADLTRGDDMKGGLATGDLGYCDSDGFFFVTGRLKRFIKMTGLRLNLDEIEKMLELALGIPVACGGKDESLQIVIESNNPIHGLEAKKRVIELYKIHHSLVHLHQTSTLAMTPSGKKDYPSIMHGLV